MIRYAIIGRRHCSHGVESIERYLPDNYNVLGEVEDFDGDDPLSAGPVVVIGGEDRAGWTLHDYVLPRLASGLIWGHEIGLEHPVMKLIASDRPVMVPRQAVKVRLPHSEVCMHMRVAGTTMWVEPLPNGMAQLYDLNGRKFSGPITRGEAGIPYE
jgi:hypothetical protein